MPTALVGGAKPGRLIEFMSKPDGSDAHPVRVLDRKGKQPLAIGPFVL